MTRERAATATERSVVFVIDDDVSVREAVDDLLTSVGLEVQTFGSIQEFLQSRRPDAPGCIVLDVRLPGPSGTRVPTRNSRIGRTASDHIHQRPQRHFHVGASDEAGRRRIPDEAPA